VQEDVSDFSFDVSFLHFAPLLPGVLSCVVLNISFLPAVLGSKLDVSVPLCAPKLLVPLQTSTAPTLPVSHKPSIVSGNVAVSRQHLPSLLGFSLKHNINASLWHLRSSPCPQRWLRAAFPFPTLGPPSHRCCVSQTPYIFQKVSRQLPVPEISHMLHSPKLRNS